MAVPAPSSTAATAHTANVAPAVVEVVDHPGLAGGGQGPFPEAGQRGDLAGGQVPAQMVGGGDVPGGFVAGVAVGFPDGGGGQAQAEGDVGGADQERGR